MSASKRILILAASIGAIVLAIALMRVREIGSGKVAADVKVNPSFPTATPPRVTPAPIVVRDITEEKGKDWRQEFGRSQDLFSLVRGAAAEGLRGNGSASLAVAKALYVCIPIQRQYAQSQDPEADFEAFWNGMTHAPQSVHEMARTDFNRYRGFLSGDAFAGLPPRNGGYESATYWNAQAVTKNDPTAQALNAGALLSTNIENAQESINKAVSSRDPGALFQVGQLLSDGHASSDRLQGFAVALAACDLGADCSGGATGVLYSDRVRKVTGEAGYAEAYARAQAFEDALSRGDTGAVQAFVRLKPTE